MSTTTVECNCKHCRTFASKKGLALPMRATVDARKAAVIPAHNLVKMAHQPPFGRMDAMQQKFGPWPVEA